MSNKRTTKRALFSSVIAMLLCVAMLIGTTFAWFTDDASTGVNKIQAGTLDIGLEMKNAEGNWVNAEGETLEWIAADGREQDEIFWEPGCTYKLPTLRIKNNGNLALQFKVLINSISGNLELLDALEFSYSYAWYNESSVVDTGTFEGSSLNNLPYEIPFNLENFESIGATDYNWRGYPLNVGTFTEAGTNMGFYTLQARMKESAGNEYQGKALENLSITVVATQIAGFESDSIDDMYDKDAEYPVVNAMDLSDPATKAEVMKVVEEDEEVGLHPVFEGKTYSVPEETLVKLPESYSRVDFANANIKCNTLVKMTLANTVLISDCNITLPEEGKLVVFENGYDAQVLIMGNVRVNGILLTEDNCGVGTELFNKYFVGVGTCFFF